MSDSTGRVSTAEAEPCAALVFDADSDGSAAPPWIWSYRAAMLPKTQQSAVEWTRIVALALALALNLGALLRLTMPPAASSPAPRVEVPGPATASAAAEDGLSLVFVEPALSADPAEAAADALVAPPSAAATPEPLTPAPPMAPMPASPPSPVSLGAPQAAVPTSPVAPDGAAVPPASDAAPAPAARLFNAEGRVVLPDAVVGELGEVESTERRFDYITPGLAGANTAFRRQPLVTYTPTRFDANWKPVRTLAGDIIAPISEMLTFRNKRKTFGCSLLPPVCSWGRTDPGHELNDPLTLNPVEDAQCQALWEQIVSTTDQTVWLSLRQRFDAECRKPLERSPLSPAAAPAR